MCSKICGIECLLLFGEKERQKKRLLLKCMHHFKSALINNMDHMRISGTEPSIMILSQTKQFKKLKSDAKRVPKQAKADMML